MSLLNAFIDSIVCVGFNSERGFTIKKQFDDNNDSPFQSSIKPYVLSMLTADQALYPQSKDNEVIDQYYPSIFYSKSSSVLPLNTKVPKKHIIPISYSNLPLFCLPEDVKISHQSEESRIHYIVFTQEDGKRSYAVVLTFPEKFILKSIEPDEDGRYEIEPYVVKQVTKKSKNRIPSSYRYENNTSHRSSTSSGTSRMRERSQSNTSLRTSNTNVFNASEPFYLPHCLVLISSHAYWTAMQETISIIHDEILQLKIEPSSNAYKQLIQKYAFLACNTPTPPIPCDHFSLSFSISNNQYLITLDPPINSNRTVLDLDLSILLLKLNIGKLLDVLSAILTQQPIIFFSSDYSKLVTTLECLLYLIYPFKWIHIYIPIVPDGLSDYYLEGPPGSYIMGVHSRHQEIVESLDLCLTCNLDNDDNILIPENIEFHPIPATKLRRFTGPITEHLHNIKTARSLQNIHSLGRLRYDEQRELERQHRIDTNYKIITIFLDLMVDLCDDTLKPIYWKIDHQQKSSSLRRSSTIDLNNHISNKTIFSKEKYLLSKTEGIEQEFYKLFIDSTAFQLFIEDEMASKIPTEFQKICQLRSLSNQDRSYHFNTELIDNHVESAMSLFETTSNQMLLPLPDWPLNITTHYLDSCIEVFTIELLHAQEERSQPIISVYAYLRGCALLTRGYLLNGLQDLYLIDNENLFPKNYIETMIIPLLSEAHLLDLFHHESFYIESTEWKKIRTNSIDSDMLQSINLEQSDNSLDDNISVKPFNDVNLNTKPTVIKDDLTFEQFYEYVHRLSIVIDKDSAAILFRALLHLIKTTNKPVDTFKRNRRWSISGSLSRETVNTFSTQPRENSVQTVSLNSSLSGKIFEVFLETWQHINVEKVRMNSYLPKDRQKNETILIISSSDIVSKKNEDGKLIVTQRGLYSLIENHSSARLLTELLNIIYIELYQFKTMFAAAKPAIRIYASQTTSSTKNVSVLESNSNPTVMLLFKDIHEQNFWYKIIFEIWSGITIAHKECDTTIFHKISKHIALIDTLTSMDYNEQTLLPNKPVEKPKRNCNMANIDKTIDELTIFTRMRNTGTFKTLNNETRKALHNRLSPSLNETKRYTASCLVFTENPDNRYSLLWCAYGHKLKMFNTTTWICNPNDISFSSVITCMCSDACDKLWIGCVKGEIFIVDTIQLICKTQLTTIVGQGGCQTMTYDTLQNRMLIGNRSGLITIWNTNNRQRLFEINLEDIYQKSYHMQQKIYKTEMLLNLRNQIEEPKTNFSSSTSPTDIISTLSNELKTIQIYDNLLFACYRDDYILIFRIINLDTFIYEDILSVKYTPESSMPIHSFLVYKHQLWISTSCIISVFNINYGNKKNSYHLIMKKHLEDDHLLTMLGFSNYICAGSARGYVYIFRMDNYELYKTFDGHKDGVCCLCSILDMYIISGSQEDDTSIVVWDKEQIKDDIATIRL
ncbi:unnamed protein product [Adineta steineri]|uniref:UDENN domain-containing protein n=2 Tax=Adineta steineri TaxID=433720 RepID=A0A818PTT2_9BILA|nr:unnamed protein product [Adineta steineri]